MKISEQYIITLFLDLMDEKHIVTDSIERLGGMNNNNYRINTDIGNFVFRLPGKGSNESVDRESELVNARLAYELGLNAKLINFDEKSGLKITEYIEEAETLTIITAKEESYMELIAEALKTLHTSEMSLYKDFDPFQEMIEYKKTIIKEDNELLNVFEQLDSSIHFLKNEIDKTQIEYVPCHIDAWPENIIRSRDKIYLIDWEYSSNYDKFWDIVSVSLECEYTQKEDELFHKKYFGRKVTSEEMVKIDLLRIIMDIHWSLWTLAKISCGEEGLYKYALDRYRRGLYNLEQFNKSNKM